MSLTNYGNPKNERQRQAGAGMSTRQLRLNQQSPTNFWFTREGNRKQVHKLLRPYWPLIMCVSSSWPHTLDVHLLAKAIEELYSFNHEDSRAIAARLHGFPVPNSFHLSPVLFNRGDSLLMKFRSQFVKVGPPTSMYAPKITLSDLLDY